MKKDIQILLNYLEEFISAKEVSSSFLLSEKEDKEMIIKIKDIAKKRKLKFWGKNYELPLGAGEK